MITNSDIVKAFTEDLEESYSYYKQNNCENDKRINKNQEYLSNLEMIKKLNMDIFSNINIKPYLDFLCDFFNKLENNNKFFAALKFANQWTDIRQPLEQDMLYLIYDEKSHFKNDFRRHAYILEANTAKEMLKIFAGDSLIFNEIKFFDSTLYTSPELNDLWMNIHALNQKLKNKGNKNIFNCNFEYLKVEDLTLESLKCAFQNLISMLVPSSEGCNDFTYESKVANYIKKELFSKIETFEEKYELLKGIKQENLFLKNIGDFLTIEDKFEILKIIKKLNEKETEGRFSKIIREGLNNIISTAVVYNLWKTHDKSVLDLKVKYIDEYTEISSPYMEQIFNFVIFNKSQFLNDLINSEIIANNTGDYEFKKVIDENLKEVKFVFKTKDYPQLNDSNFIDLLMKASESTLEIVKDTDLLYDNWKIFNDKMKKICREDYLNKLISDTNKVEKNKRKI